MQPVIFKNIQPSGEEHLGQELLRLKGLINFMPVSVLLDTGAAVNLIGLQTCHRVGLYPVNDKRKLKGIGNIQCTSVGIVSATLSLGAESRKLQFLVLQGEDGILLSKQGIAAFGFILYPALDKIIQETTKQEILCNQEKLEQVEDAKTKGKQWHVTGPEGSCPKQEDPGTYTVKMPTDMRIKAGETVVIDTYTTHKFPQGVVAQLIGDVNVLGPQELEVSPGLIISGSPVKFVMTNKGGRDKCFKTGQRVARLVLMRGLTPPLLMMTQEKQSAQQTQEIEAQNGDFMVECLRPVEKRLLPKVVGNKTLFYLGSSVVLAAKEARMIQTPFQISFTEKCKEKALSFTDCLNADAAVHIKIRQDGVLIMLVRNWGTSPMHLTPGMQAFWVNGVLTTSHADCTAGKTIKKEASVYCGRLDTTSDVVCCFPKLFSKADPTCTDAMCKLQITTQHVQWIKPICYSSQVHRQSISVAQEDKVQAALSQLESDGVIVKMADHETGLFSQLIVVPKPNGDVRLTVDLRAINTLHAPHKSPLTPVRELLSKVPSHWKIYSKLDLYNGFYSIPISRALGKFFCFYYGRFRFRFVRLVQGWSNSPCVFHELMVRILSSTPAIVYLDDILIGGSDSKEHSTNLRLVLYTLETYGLRLRAHKIHIASSAVTFLGYQLSNGTYNPSPMIHKAMKNMPHIFDKQTLQKGLGLINHLREHVPLAIQDLDPWY